MSTRFDVIVVGAGAVGMSLAARLSKPGRRIALLELAEHPADGMARLLEGASTGSHRGAREGWMTGAGGTTQLWGGQLWPWRPDEFDGWPAAGIEPWPFGFDELQPRYLEALQLLGLPAAHADLLFGSTESPLGADLVIRRSTWIDWGRRNFARNPSLRRALREVNRRSGAEVLSVDAGQVTLADGERLEADSVVLAAGTLGNTRILSASPIAADLPALGAGFMDHVSARHSTWQVDDWHSFRAFAAPRYVRGVLTSPRFVPNRATTERIGGPPAYAHWEAELAERSFAAAARNARRDLQARRVPHLGALVTSAPRGIAEVADALAERTRGRRLLPTTATMHLRVDVQQPVRPSARISWTGSQPVLQVDWQVGEQERRAAAATGDLVAESIAAAGVGARLVGREATLDLQDTFHLMGGTRISAAAAEGVVDSNLRVHGMPRLFVAGPSVFPSGGMANPTFTGIALALRLADHLEEL